LFAAASCSTQEAVVGNEHIKFCPPGTIEIDSNFFCDQFEICNTDWREYEYWTARVYGKKSVPHLACLPDTLCWRKEKDTCFFENPESYYRHPGLNYWPVVGISQEQALAYSKWRADRVLEVILINNKFISQDTAPTPESHFTIERYFNGTLTTYLTNERVKYYPKYSLPTLQERDKILAITDSLNRQALLKANSRKRKDCLANYPQVNSIEKPCKTFSGIYTLEMRKKKIACSEWLFPVYELHGGVSEWSSETNIAFGGSWKESREDILASDTARSFVGATTGFRNVCRWVKWQP
jgi:hypothetical protein